MKKVLYICNEDLRIGGASLSLMNMLQSLEGKVEPILLFRQEGPAAELFRQAGYNCVIIPFRRATFHAKGLVRVLRFLPHATTTAIDYDVVVTNVEGATVTVSKVKANVGNEITITQTIHAGWNWIGPLSIYNLSLGEAFADLQPTRGDIVKSKNQVAFYDGYKWEGDLTAIIPGMGYYYKSNNVHEVTFRYPTIDASYSQAPAVVMRAPAELPFTPVDHHQFSDNMNVVARVVKGDTSLDNLCVAAFIDEECRGVATATDEGLYLLTVAGNAEEAGKTVRFATLYNGETAWFNEELQWLSDWIYGNLEEPQLLTLGKTGIDDINTTAITITPTLVVDVLKVRAGDRIKSVNVYSVNGMLMDRFNPDDTRAELDLSHLFSGVYFVEACTDRGARTVKRIIKR